MNYTAADIPAEFDSPIVADAVVMLINKEQGPEGGPALVSYLCPAKKWTLGFGTTGGIGPGMRCTVEHAWQMLQMDLHSFTLQVQQLLTAPATPNQLGALVVFTYNVGIEAFRTSSVRKFFNAGDLAATAREMLRWNKAHVDGKLVELPGLTTRRHAEAALLTTPEPEAWRQPMPQEVAAPPSIAASPTILTSTGGLTLAGTAAAAAQFKEQLSPVAEAIGWAKGVAADWGVTPQLVPWLLLAGVSGLVLYRRLKQRAQGLA